MTRRSLREGRRYVVAALGAEAALAALGHVRGRVIAAVALVCAVFLRDPSRRVDAEPGVLYAPADGVVTGVDLVDEAWLPGGAALRITTFLALWDVHVNRSPAPGVVVEAEALPGGFAPAFLGRATENHRKRLAIEDGGRRVVLVQMAGLVARRISSWAWKGDRVRAGEPIALIHFGSRADVLAPAADVRPLVQTGQRVRAGITPLARYVEGAIA